MILIFDMDGVLVEPGDSYREAICQTVEHFSRIPITRELIHDYKNQGGWNNDWALSQQILRDQGCEIPYHQIVDYFTQIFLGDTETEGLILRERWIPKPGLLERLSRNHRLSLFTGRDRGEATRTLTRFAPALRFNPLMTADIVRRPKPAPDGLLDIAAAHPNQPLLYIGDTVDDARSASGARVPFVGIAAATHPRRPEILRLFEQENAIAVLPDINELERVL